ncbi:hypothetical protein QX233_11140 [Chryseobacterium gambrini]|uniref:Uncharacterized protein n=1 Tax=Chryseobacterium gambrini TaxID=373672 RepID=A0AAJ1R3R4_9FLAO|nr:MULTISPECIES: hypothetical protein [Chryseobacterium]MDN4013019.1 hypothetical protein [Chryseobacterium gambrini]MDN4030704.1 hypothetical protein [Chryseobacterium gambrini]QWA38689.1 hypothetical protein KKI44_00285 [Chryseobacterium sp. ZHDP1]
MKFGIIFYSILGVLALIIGVYLLQYLFILSIIFFIGAFINGVFIYKEYNIHKSDKIEYNENTLPDEIIVKYSRSGRIIAIATYSIFMMLGILFISSIKFKMNFITIFVLALLIAFTGYFISKIIVEIKKISKVMISVNGKGIQIENNPTCLWNEIQLEKIIVKRLVSRESKHDYKPEINYLYFFHGDEKIEINIDDFDITDYQLSQVLKIFRSRYNNSGLL